VTIADDKTAENPPRIFEGSDSSPLPFPQVLAVDSDFAAGRISQTRLAVSDIFDGLIAWRLWALLGWQDIRLRYRRSKIGPFWMTLSMGFMIAGMGYLYSELFHTDVTTYLPYLTVGIILWGMIGTTVTESCMAFIDGESIIKQTKLPLTLYVCRVLWRNLIIFAHNFVIFVLVAAIFKVPLGWSDILAVPGLLLLCVNGIWIGLFWGSLSARFRDVPQIVGSVIQIAFFMTPVMWETSSISQTRSWILEYNPFYYFLAVVREPLLGRNPGIELWLVSIAITLVGWIFAFAMFRRCRSRIAYWL
jgi:ABC-2 type transport system permease protein